MGGGVDVEGERHTLADIMTDSLTLGCPHCGEDFSIAFDVSEGSAEFIVDCEVCCAPMTVTVRVSEDGEIESLDVTEA